MNTFKYTDHAAFDSTFAEQGWYNAYTGELVIETTNGDLLRYQEVPNDIGIGFLNADSQGRYYQRAIRGILTSSMDIDIDFFVLDAPADEKSIEAEIKSEEDFEPLGRYTVTSYFDSAEDAFILFSYAEGLGNHTTLTAYDE